MRTQTNPPEGVESCLDGSTLKMRIYLDRVESQMEKWISEGHIVGGYLLGIPVRCADADYWNGEIAQYVFDRSIGLHTEAFMYEKGNPRMAKWYLENLRESGLLIMTEKQIISANHSVEIFDHRSDIVRELGKTNSIRVTGGWCLPDKGALERLRLGDPVTTSAQQTYNRNGEFLGGDLYEVDQVEISVFRVSEEVAKYGSKLSDRNGSVIAV